MRIAVKQLLSTGPTKKEPEIFLEQLVRIHKLEATVDKNVTLGSYVPDHILTPIEIIQDVSTQSMAPHEVVDRAVWYGRPGFQTIGKTVRPPMRQSPQPA